MADVVEPELSELDARFDAERAEDERQREALEEPVSDARTGVAAEKAGAEKLLAIRYTPPTDLGPQGSLMAKQGMRVGAILAQVREALQQRIEAAEFTLRIHEGALAALVAKQAVREAERQSERAALLEKIAAEDDRLIRAMARKGLSLKGSKQ